MADVTKSDLFFIWCLSWYLYSVLPSFSFFLCPSSQPKRFLRCSPFDEFNLWRSQVDNGTKKGGERLSILTRSLLLRRTKDQLDSTGKPLVISFTCVPGGGQGRMGTMSLSWVEQPSASLREPLNPTCQAEPWVAVLHPCHSSPAVLMLGSPTFREGWRLLSSLD